MNVYYKKKNKEFGRNAGNKYYFYDFVIPEIKYAIEYNGSFWHADPDWYGPDEYIELTNTKRLVSDIWQEDYDKVKFLQNEGFHVNVIWGKTNKNKDFNQTILNFICDFNQHMERLGKNERIKDYI
jgi:G:T-mismatch repair DNA endonuclease (very short patch repair protein)